MMKISESTQLGCSTPNTYNVIIELMSREPRGKVLDIGTGAGRFASKLATMGFDIFCCDITDEAFEVKNLPFEKVNLNKKLPYSDHYFDFVTAVEVIEHLESTNRILREVNRILVPEGKFLFSTPNNFSFLSRVHYLLYGWPGSFGSLHDWLSDKIEEIEDIGHINPINYPILQDLIEKYGFEVENLSANRLKYTTALCPLSKITRMICTFFTKLHSKNLPFAKLLEMSEASYKKNEKTFSQKELLFGETLIMLLKKVRNLEGIYESEMIMKND